jgi:ADYC domain
MYNEETMSYSRTARSLCYLAIALAPAGCAVGDEAATATVASEEGGPGFDPYVGHQGRLLLGLKDPDVRRFQLAGVLGARVIADGQLIADGLAGHDLAGKTVFSHTDVLSIEMRITDVKEPRAPGEKWQYGLEQLDPVTGVWEPACAEPLQLIPSGDPPSGPPLALAIPGHWSRDGMYSVNAGTFSFACHTGVVAKCDFWGYPVTADPPDVTELGLATSVTGADMMQACTRMARFDYCADGVPNTLDGTPIRFDDIFQTPPDADGWFFEAAWPGLAIVDRRIVRSPAICLSKQRWSTIPLGGSCTQLPDPRIDSKGKFCEDMSPVSLELKGARTYSSSAFIDAGLYTYTNPFTGTRLTTASLLPEAATFPPAWQISPVPPIGFPVVGGPAPRFEGTMFATVLPPGLPVGDLKKLTSYACPDDDLVTTTSSISGCEKIAEEGHVYAPHTPGRAPLRRWWNPGVKRSVTTTVAPTTMIAEGWQLSEVVGAVIRAEIDVNLRWSALGGATYSLAVQSRTGEWISPCLDASQLGTATSAVYRGRCISAANRRVNHADIVKFQITATTSAGTKVGVQPYNGVDSDAYVEIAGGTTTAVAITWGGLGEGHTYALDVRPVGSGNRVGCVSDDLLANSASHVHAGPCYSAGITVKPNKIAQLRICATKAGDDKPWTCSEVDYDGRNPRMHIDMTPAK